MPLKDALYPEKTDLTKDIKVGDLITLWATGYLRLQVGVTKVTPTYVWVEYTTPAGIHHNTKFRRS